MKHDSINEKCVRPLKKAVGKKSNKNAFVMKSHLLGLLYPDQTESIVRISKTKKKNTLFFAVQSGNHWWLLWMLWILSGGWCWQIVWRCISNLSEDIFRFSPLCVLNTKLIWTILGPPYIPCPLYQKNGEKSSQCQLINHTKRDFILLFRQNVAKNEIEWWEITDKFTLWNEARVPNIINDLKFIHKKGFQSLAVYDGIIGKSE